MKACRAAGARKASPKGKLFKTKREEFCRNGVKTDADPDMGT
jgi:hypothetical protein